MKKTENLQHKKFTKILAMVCALLLTFLILFAILVNAFSPLAYAEDDVSVSSTISDLSDTYWFFHSTIELRALDLKYINFVSYGGDFTSLDCYIHGLYYNYTDTSYVNAYNNHGWVNDGSRFIHIVDGEDVTDTDLISFLYDNAVLVEHTVYHELFSYIGNDTLTFDGMPWDLEEVKQDNSIVDGTVLLSSDVNFTLLDGTTCDGWYLSYWNDYLYGEGYYLSYVREGLPDVLAYTPDGWFSDGHKVIIFENSLEDTYTSIIDGQPIIVAYYQYLFLNNNFVLGNLTYEQVISYSYQLGYYSGYDRGYFEGFSNGEDQGYSNGYDAGYSAGLGNSLLGETLDAPFNALNSIILYRSSTGFNVTLLGVLSTVIGLSLFIWFMKMFAGG